MQARQDSDAASDATFDATSDATGVLLISCPDRPGIVATVATFVFERDGNILHSHQHTDPESNEFYMRVQWVRGPASPAWSEIPSAFAPLGHRLGMDWQLRVRQAPPRTAIFVSREDHCLWDLLLRQRAGELAMDVALVISNHEHLRPVAESFGVPFAHFAVTPETKAEVEAQAIALLQREHIELVVLARYMQVLSPTFVEAFPRGIINIHHSFLPAFKGARPYHQAYDRGVKVVGATSHYVTEDLDQGPIIEQDVVRISHRDSVQDIIRRGRDLEKVVLARAVRLHLSDRVLVVGKKTVVFD